MFSRKLSPAKKKFEIPNSLQTSRTALTRASNIKMRPLTEEETKTLFAKLANYTGNSLKNLIAPLDNGANSDRYVFRLHQQRCYYVRLSLANMAVSVSRDKLLSLGTCLGKAQPLNTSECQLTKVQASSPRLGNSVFTLQRFQSCLNMHDTRSGSRRMARCLSYMEDIL